MKEIGKVYETNGAFFHCPCGASAYNNSYLYWKEGSSIIDIANNPDLYYTIRIAICGCGNVSVRQKLTKEQTNYVEL